METAQGSWYGPVDMIMPEPETRAVSFPLVRTSTQGQSVYPDICIALYISNYCVYCIGDHNLTHAISMHINL